MENYKGEKYPRTLDLITTDFSKAITAVDEHLKSQPMRLKQIATFNNKGQVVIRKDYLIKKFGLEAAITPTKYYGNDLKGLYVFADIKKGQITYKYVGISRCVFKRLKDHGFGKTKDMATLVNLMAKHRYRQKYGHVKGYRFNKYLKETQAEVSNWYVALYPISCNFELHMAEPHLAYHWKAYWNSFETH